MTNLADQMPFSKLMGVEVTESSKERVVGTLVVREDLCTAGGILVAYRGIVECTARTVSRTHQSYIF